MPRGGSPLSSEPGEAPAAGPRFNLRAPLLALLLGVAYLAWLVFRPFLLVFTVAAAVALLLAPLQKRLSAAMAGRGGLAAGLLALATGILILLPVAASATLVGRQALASYQLVKPYLEPATLQALWESSLLSRHPWLRDVPGLAEGEFAEVAADALRRAASFTNGLIQGAVTGLSSAFLDLALFLLMLFFLLRDGARLRGEFRGVSPLSREQERLIFEHLGRTVKGTLLAMLVVPFAQGAVAIVGFLVFGVPSPLAWGVLVVLASFVPLLGSPLGWVPACVYLFLTAETWRWSGMLVWGILLISGIDNLIKPLVLRGAAQIHPLLGFLAILGGVFAFGPAGFLVGPVILSLVLSALRIYRADVLRRGGAPADAGPPAGGVESAA